MEASRVTILGVRGSVPISDPDFARYGGATTSVLVQLAGTDILLDAGTGIMRLGADVLERPELNLLLTHVHLDHLNGLAMCPFVMRSGKAMDVYAAPQEGIPAEEVLHRLYAPPIWPVTPDRFFCKMRFHGIAPRFTVGAVQVESMEGVHPGGVRLFRLSAGGRSVVFATDFTLTEETRVAVTDFAAGCDLLLCDGQYSDGEWPVRAAFGHNTWKTAAQFGLDCGARMTRIIHHDPTHDDAQLDRASAEVRAVSASCALAREGEVIVL